LSLTDTRSEITRGAQALADILEEKHGKGRALPLHLDAPASAAVEGDC
jgi:hypothetical protein